MGIGSIDNPYVENPFAGRITNVHWDDDGDPGETDPRSVFALFVFSEVIANGFWTATETGTETGSVTLLWSGGGDPNVSMVPISFSGANIFGSNPVTYVSIAPGAHYVFTLTVNGTLDDAPNPALETDGTVTADIRTIDPATGAAGGAVVSASVTVHSGETQSMTAGGGGTAPSNRTVSGP